VNTAGVDQGLVRKMLLRHWPASMTGHL